MKAIFLVKSPLQLLNAVEARGAFGLADPECLLLLMANRKSLEQLMNLVRHDNAWTNVAALDDLPLNPVPFSENGRVVFRKGSGLFANDLYGIIKLKNLARNSSCVEKVFVGDLGNTMMIHFANSLPETELVSLDDGNATYKYADERCGNRSFSRAIKPGKKLKLSAKRALLGLRDGPPEAVNFFTAYDIVAGRNDKVTRHSFKILRESLGPVAQSDEVYFLGSPLVEAGILTDEELLAQLALVADVLSEKEVVYVVHRREDPARVGRISNALGWETVLFDFPIEYQLAKVGPRPNMLASFFSSAIENSLTLFGETLQVTSYRFSPDFFAHKDTPRGQGICSLYDHYESMQSRYFEVVQLAGDKT